MSIFDCYILQGVGTITIRLRKEIADDKALLMSSLKPSPRFNINMQKKATLSVANFTCCGEVSRTNNVAH